MTTLTRPIELEAMTTVEAKIALEEAEAVIIPIGSTEQHGSNMTMNTDTRLAVEVSRRIATFMYPRLVVLPAIPVGISYHHMAFAGSMTLSPNTLQAVLFDFIKSMKKHGIRRFVFLNGHGGNQQVLSTAATVALHELEVEALNVFYWNLATSEIRERASTPRYGHACEIEASFGLHLDPGIVRQNSLRPASLMSYPLPYTGFEAVNKADYPYPWEMITEDGSLGDATKASAGLGEELIGIIVARLEELLAQFLRMER